MVINTLQYDARYTQREINTLILAGLSTHLLIEESGTLSVSTDSLHRVAYALDDTIVTYFERVLWC